MQTPRVVEYELGQSYMQRYFIDLLEGYPCYAQKWVPKWDTPKAIYPRTATIFRVVTWYAHATDEVSITTSLRVALFFTRFQKQLERTLGPVTKSFSCMSGSIYGTSPSDIMVKVSTTQSAVVGRSECPTPVSSSSTQPHTEFHTSPTPRDVGKVWQILRKVSDPDGSQRSGRTCAGCLTHIGSAFSETVLPGRPGDHA